jgi:ribose transport system ATP-binding protein
VNCIIDMQNICRSFPGVDALKSVNLKIHEKEILGFVGENGAGKSTLMKILCGADTPTDGQILFYGKPVSLRTPKQSQEHGIFMVQQELSLVPSMTVMENLLLGSESAGKFLGHLKQKENLKIAYQALQDVGLTIHPLTTVAKLSVATQQMVEIARNLIHDPKVLILDEPTAALSKPEIDRLFSILRELRAKGVGIIFISHKLEEILELVDTITVQRDGCMVKTFPAKNVTRSELISLMVGRTLESQIPRHNIANRGEELLRVEHVSRANQFQDISFKVNAGEIVGMFGLKGSGRSEVATAVFGGTQLDEGRVLIRGNQVNFKSPKDAIDNGMAFLTEDRKSLGLFLGMPVKDNICVSNLEGISAAKGIINPKLELEVSKEYVQRLGVKTPSVHQIIKYLSGGNQQKVLLARWIYRGSDILILDEPTKGIDVGAKHDIYLLMSDLSAQGKGIVMISSEIDEILAISDIIVVMRMGHISAVLKRNETSREEIMNYAAG